MQPRNRQQMRKVRCSQIGQRVLPHGRPVAGHDRGRKGPGFARHGLLDRRRNRHARRENAHRPARPCRGCQPQHRGAGIPHGPQLQKPRMALEIKTARLCRTCRGGQMPGHDQHLSRAIIADHLFAMHRHPHARGRPVGGHIRQHHPVQRQPGCIAGGSVDIDDPPFDWAVIAEIQHRGRHRIGAPFGQPHARQNKHQRQKQRRIGHMHHP